MPTTDALPTRRANAEARGGICGGGRGAAVACVLVGEGVLLGWSLHGHLVR